MPPQTDNPLVAENTSEQNYYQADQQDGDPLANMSAPEAGSGTGFMTGVTTFEAGWAIAQGIDSGQWKVALSGYVAFGLDAASAVLDPIGFVAGQIVSWMLEHIEPARRMLDELAGNPDMVNAYAESWTNVEDEMTAVGEELKAAAARETANWQGQAADAYRKQAENLAGMYGGAAGAAHGIASLTKGMAEVVNGVRIAVRDILSAIAGALISWTIELAATAGLAAPGVIAQAIGRIASVLSKCAMLSGKLATVVDAAITALVALRDFFDGLIRAINDLEKGQQTAPVQV